MVLEVVKYGHPMLRQEGARIDKITPEVEQLIADMFETMHANRGIGLAAQQVGRALLLTVIDVREVTDRPSTLFLEGQPADVETFMPLVLINPEVKPVADPVTGPEGCLSFPEIYAEIERPESAEVTALDREGKPITFRCGGLLARAIQHEVDHLHGVLFIDRLAPDTKRELKAELEELHAETQARMRANR